MASVLSCSLCCKCFLSQLVVVDFEALPVLYSGPFGACLQTQYLYMDICLQHPKGKMFACFIDFRKAYDSVCHKALFHKLANLKISDNFIDVLKNIYSKTTCAVKVDDSRIKFVNYTKGVRQGCPLSPLLFNTFINDLAKTLEDKSVDSFTLPNGFSLNCLMYSDDIVIFSKTANGLQTLLNKVQVYCDS